MIAFVAAAVGLIMSGVVLYKLVSNKKMQQLDFE